MLKMGWHLQPNYCSVDSSTTAFKKLRGWALQNFLKVVVLEFTKL